MKKENSEVRKKMLVVRMNLKEYEALKKLQGQSTTKRVSTYARNVLLQKPVVIKYRNASADDFLRDMLLLKRELNAIGNNFNQAVKKLHLLDRIPEFRNWVQRYEDLHREVSGKMEEIKMRMNQLYEQWLQK